MTSNHSPELTAQTVRDKRTLRCPRREAGYRSSEKSAFEIGAPASAYECKSDSPDCGTPLHPLRLIADKFGCSMGQDIDAPKPNSIQARYDALTPEGRELVDGYLSYVEFGEQATASAQRRS